MLSHLLESLGNENARNDLVHELMHSMDIITIIDNMYANE